MHEIELVLALLVATTALAPAARVLRVPYPILLVLGGLILALIPAVPNVALAPELVFLLFLPPLLYISAYNTSIREVKERIWSILGLAVGLTLATTAAVAVVVHALLPDAGWAVAFALGAIVSPPDAVAATAVFQRLGVPRGLVTLLESESLFNDATALVAYQTALTAMAAATVTAGGIGIRFLVVSLGGILLGLVIGIAIAKLRRYIVDPAVEITVSLLTPFGAWLAAEALGVSAVLATVTTGLCIGWWAPRIMSPDTRLRSRAVWEMVVFILQGLVFILLGLQLSSILSGRSGESLLATIGLGALISAVAIVVRLLWVYAGNLLVRLRGHTPGWREATVAGWSGMRGVVSLAAALALPLELPERQMLIFLTFCVILATLVGQGLTLPLLIRKLGVVEDGGEAHKELHARITAGEAATERIEQLAEEWPDHLPLIESLRAQYSHRSSHLGEKHTHGEDGEPEPSEDAEQEMLEHRLIRRAVIDAERDAILDLRSRGDITDDVWRRIERDLDLEAVRMDA